MKSYLNLIAGVSYVSKGDLSVFGQDIMANEILYRLEQSSVLLQLVHRDFDPLIATQGTSVSIRRPGKLRAYRKSSSDPVTVQSLDAEKITVPLDQHLHVSFTVADEDMSKSDEDLMSIYAPLAADGLVRSIERAIAARMLQFNKLPAVGSLGSAVSDTSLNLAGAILDNYSNPADGRIAIVTPNQYQALLNVAKFSEADKVGDDGAAVRLAQLGVRGGFNFFKTNNMPSVTTVFTTTSTTTTAAAKAGDTTIAVTAATGIGVGSCITLVGDVQPFIVTNVAALVLTLDRPLRSAVASGATVTVQPRTTIASNYAAGYRKEITTAAWTGNAPAEKNAVTIGGKIYTILERTDATHIMLDRPLESAVTSGDYICAVAAGEYGFLGNPKSIAFVCRPLALYPSSLGAMQSVVNAPESQLSVRVSLQYSGSAQSVLFTADLLCGTQLLDTEQGLNLLA